MNEITITPSMENLEVATAFFEDLLTEADAPMKAIMQVNVAVDEVMSNIIRYSGASTVTLGCDIADGKAVLRFSDDGKFYDPTVKADPDTTLSAEERDIGGLGIFMVKKTMDGFNYEYKNGHNILTLEKRLKTEEGRTR